MALRGPTPQRVQVPVVAAQEQRLAVDNQMPWSPLIGALSLDPHAKAGRKNVKIESDWLDWLCAASPPSEADRQLVQARLAALPGCQKPRGCQVKA